MASVKMGKRMAFIHKGLISISSAGERRADHDAQNAHDEHPWSLCSVRRGVVRWAKYRASSANYARFG